MMIPTVVVVTAVTDHDTTNQDPTTTTTNNDDHTKYFVMGLPKSGSYWIHSFIHCMNEMTKKTSTSSISSSSSTTSSSALDPPSKEDQEERKAPPRRSKVLSSAHYCCDPHRADTTTTTTTSENNNNIDATSFFPCPSPMIPCGTCLYDHSDARRSNKNEEDDEADEERTTTTSTSTATPHWTASCGNYQVFTNFHVEGTTHKKDTVRSTDPYTFFLPQHYLLPHLVHPPKNDPQHNTTTVWILNHRGTAEQWATNVGHWYSITQRILNSFQIPYYSSAEEEEEDPKPHEELTLSDWQDALDTTSFERMHNQTDHQRRWVELVQIYHYHNQRIQQFVQDYNHQNHHQIQLYDINIDDTTVTPLVLARALGYISMNDNAVDTETATLQQQCWPSHNEYALDLDYMDFNLTTTFRASV